MNFFRMFKTPIGKDRCHYRAARLLFLDLADDLWVSVTYLKWRIHPEKHTSIYLGEQWKNALENSRIFFIEVHRGCVRIVHGNIFHDLVKEEADRMETIKKYYRIDRAGIAYVRFILEAYDGIANMTTLDPQQGLVRMAIAPGCTAEMDFIVSDLKRNILIEPVDIESNHVIKPWIDK